MPQYKISKARLAEIIKEEYQSLQHRKSRRLNEDASDDTFDMVDVIVGALGPQQALEELVQAMERQNAHDLLSYVIRMHDLGGEDAANRTDEKLTLDQVESDEISDEDLDEGYMDALDRDRADRGRQKELMPASVKKNASVMRLEAHALEPLQRGAAAASAAAAAGRKDFLALIVKMRQPSLTLPTLTTTATKKSR